MELQLKNIGMIKEANVKIDGLTVIAGENDTGKSTLSKALYLIYNSMTTEKYEKSSAIFDLGHINIQGKYIKNKIFSEQSFDDSSLIKISKDDKSLEYDDKFCKGELSRKDMKIASISFIETPLVWNLQNLFRSSSDIESFLKSRGEDIVIPYPFLMKDLYFHLSTQRDFEEKWTSKFRNKIISVLGGEFKKDADGIFRFYRNDDTYDLMDIATGIKTFGILQVLLDNNRLNSYSLIVLDEPEVHLHPKWQLEMAKIIVELVGKGVKVVVNSHSPYMMEALKRYSDKENLQKKTNFYLAEGGYIHKIKESNALTLEKIFEKLSEPFDVFEEMDSQKMKQLING